MPDAYHIHLYFNVKKFEKRHTENILFKKKLCTFIFETDHKMIRQFGAIIQKKIRTYRL